MRGIAEGRQDTASRAAGEVEALTLASLSARPTPSEALRIEPRQNVWIGGDPLSNGDRGAQLIVGQMTDCGTAHSLVPGLADGVIQGIPA